MVVFGSKIPKLGRKAIVYGAAIMSLGLAILISTIFAIGITINSWQIAPGLIIAGVGMGLLFGALYSAVLNGVDTKHAGSASGTLNAVQQVGAAIGVAVIGVIYFGQLSAGSAIHFESVEPRMRTELAALNLLEPAQEAIIKGSEACFVDRAHQKDSSIVPESCQSLSSDPAASADIVNIVTDAVKEANAINFQHAFRWAIVLEVGFAIISIGLAFLLPKKFNHDVV
jgi:hypothetical protein